MPDKSAEVYSFCLPHPRGDVDVFRKAFEEHVGLTFVPAKREIDVLVIGPGSRHQPK